MVVFFLSGNSAASVFYVRRFGTFSLIDTEFCKILSETRWL